MSGFIENSWDRYGKKFILKMYPDLGYGGEWPLGMQHMWQMLSITMSINFAAAIFCKYIFILTILSGSLIAIAEWPPQGRKIDVITRSSGWVIGSIIAIIGFFIS